MISSLGGTTPARKGAGGHATERAGASQLRRFTVTLLCGVVGSLSLTAAPAFGLATNAFTTTFAGSGTNALSNPAAVAVDNSTGSSAGDVYVTDPVNHRVEKFGPTGEFLLMFGKDVNQTTGGDVCTAISGNVCQVGIAGSLPGAFEAPAFLAVDNSTDPSAGDVYVGDTGDNKITKFEPDGNLIGSWGTGGQLDGSTAARGPFGESFGGIAVSQSGELFVVNNSYGLYRFAQDGSLIAEHGFGPSVAKNGLAVNSAGNIFFVQRNGEVAEVSSEGERLNGAFAPSPATGVAIVPGDELYVSYSDHVVHYNASDESLDEFGSGHITVGSGVALDGQGDAYVADSSGHVIVFDVVVLPNVTTGSVQNQDQTSGTFIGHVAPGAEAAEEITSCSFQYVTEAAFNETGFSDLSSGGELSCREPQEPPFTITGPTEVKGNFSGLEIETPYVFRLVAGNANGSNATAKHFTFTLHAVTNLTTEAATHVTPSSAQFNGAFEGNEQDTHYYFEWGAESEGFPNKTPVPPADAGSPKGPTSVAPITLPDHTLSPETAYHYRIVASNVVGTTEGNVQTFTTPAAVAELKSSPATNFTPTSAELNGSFAGNGEDTRYYFEWGIEGEGYPNKTPASPADAGSPNGPETTSVVPIALTGLSPLTPYNFRIAATNGEGITRGNNETFELPLLPLVNESISDVHSDSALLHTEINPGGGDTTFHFEYATEKEYGEHESYGHSSPDADAGSGLGFTGIFTQSLGNLAPGTTYHWRVVAKNPSGITDGPDRMFTTYPFVPLLVDHCINAHLRQQTGSAELPDCRAYELVSAGNSGGYDIESNLVGGQTPYGGYPQAENPARVLYGVHDGGIPGTGDPTNRGVDPYIATRGENGWTTEYVGVPATDPFSKAPFSSVPSGAGAGLETFAFGGPGGCSPCFEGGYAGIPVHLPNGRLVQGMVASSSVPQPPSSAIPDGYIAKDLSANGEQFIFGSTSRFAAGGNDETGDVSIYDHDLNTGTTHVVSDNPAGQPLECLQGIGKCNSTEHDANGIGELDISKDGSHILLGQKVATDTDGNAYWHLYMNIGDSAKTIDLTPGATDGVLYDGMTENGSKVFFTTVDQLATATNQDTDHSADIYMWSQVGEEEGTPLSRISTGREGTGNTDSCDPVANSAHEHWNTVGPEASCGVVAIGGGGGVAADNGAIYFLSPEKLDGSANGVHNAPNLYVTRPGDGYVPHYVTTLESSLNGPQPPPTHHAFLRSFGSFGNPEAEAVDQSTGDIYVLDRGSSSIKRFTSTGKPDPFTAPGSPSYINENELIGTTEGGFSFEGGSSEAQVALAPPGSPGGTAGDIYVDESSTGMVDIFSHDGEYLGRLNGSGNTNHHQGGELCGLATDPSGDLYLSYFSGHVDKYVPSANPPLNSDFDSEISGLSSPCAVAASSSVLYTSTWPIGPLTKYQLSLFPGSGAEADASGQGTVLEAHGNPVTSTAVAVDPTSEDVFVDEGDQLSQFDSSGNQIGGPIRAGALSGSSGVAAKGGDIYASNPGTGNVDVFGPLSLVPSPAIDNPAVLDAVSEPETRHTADFQDTPSGDFAVFTSTLPLPSSTKYDNAGHSEIYRYDANSETLACVSCDPTGVEPSFDSTLASNGLSLTDDGRVLFTSAEPLVAPDLDEKKDVYEWEAQGTGTCQSETPSFSAGGGACLQLISAGTSPFDSGLLSVTATGTNVYFFTRDSLAPQDQNGPTLKIYDAREGGGFPYEPPPPTCKASDECHGPGTQAQEPPRIRTIAGTASKYSAPTKCNRGFVRKGGECVRKPNRKKHHHKRSRHQRVTHHRGGAK